MGLHHFKPAEVYCDNLSVVHLTANPVLHKRTKNFETHYHYARERIAKGLLVVQHVPAIQQLADVFTKSLPFQSFRDLRYKLGVDVPPTSSLRGDISKAGPQALEKFKPTQKLNTPTVTCAQNRQTSDKKDNGPTSAIKTRNRFLCLR